MISFCCSAATAERLLLLLQPEFQLTWMPLALPLLPDTAAAMAWPDCVMMGCSCVYWLGEGLDC
jgi:hypothetical protein